MRLIREEFFSAMRFMLIYGSLLSLVGWLGFSFFSSFQ